MTTIRIILSLAAINNWHLHQLYINTTFVDDGYLYEEYLLIRKFPIKTLSCKLNRSIYGLNQASSMKP